MIGDGGDGGDGRKQSGFLYLTKGGLGQSSADNHLLEVFETRELVVEQLQHLRFIQLGARHACMHANTISPQRASGWPTTAVSRISGQSVKLGNHNGDDGCHEAFRPSCCEFKALVAAIAAGYVCNHKPDWERWWIAELDRQRTGVQVGSGARRHRMGLPVALYFEVIQGSRP